MNNHIPETGKMVEVWIKRVQLMTKMKCLEVELNIVRCAPAATPELKVSKAKRIAEIYIETTKVFMELAEVLKNES